MNKTREDLQKKLQVGSYVKVPVGKYKLQGTVIEMTDDEVTVEVPTYYIPSIITNTYKKEDVILISNKCPKRAGE